jgi:hypothetical protein
MSIGLIFWIIMLIWLIFALAWNFNWAPGIAAHGPLGNSLLLFVLFLLLGWKAFGAPVHG